MPLVPTRARSYSVTARWVFRVLGALLVVAGLIWFITSIVDITHFMGADSMEPPPPHDFIGFVGGFAVFGIGMQLLNVGFLGAISQYAAYETAPAITTVTSAVRDGWAPSAGSEPTGPYCSKCGLRNREAARFCDACGAPLAAV